MARCPPHDTGFYLALFVGVVIYVEASLGPVPMRRHPAAAFRQVETRTG